MPPRLIDPIVKCEGCGETQEDMAIELRKMRIAMPGKQLKITAASLRAPYWCEGCITKLKPLLRLSTEQLAYLAALAGDPSDQPERPGGRATVPIVPD